MAEDQFAIETECVHQIAETNCLLTVPTAFAIKLRERGRDLTDVIHVMRFGDVIRSDMQDRVAVWVVRGELLDGGSMILKLTFSFNDLHAVLIDVL